MNPFIHALSYPSSNPASAASAIVWPALKHQFGNQPPNPTPPPRPTGYGTAVAIGLGAAFVGWGIPAFAAVKLAEKRDWTPGQAFVRFGVTGAGLTAIMLALNPPQTSPSGS